MPPPGMQCRPIWQPASKPAQKPRNGPNENGKNTRSPGCDARAAIHRLPAIQHPLPALVRVDPAQRPTGRRRGLAVSRVALERLGQRGAPWRIRFLIGDELRLGRSSAAASDRSGSRKARDVDTGCVELPSVERVSTVNPCSSSRQAPALSHGQRITIEPLGRMRRFRSICVFRHSALGIRHWSHHFIASQMPAPSATANLATISGGMDTAFMPPPGCFRTQTIVTAPVAIFASPRMSTQA